MPLPQFGETVRKARRDAKVSLVDMAGELETSASFLSAMETGRSKIPSEWVEKIADYLNSVKEKSVDRDKLLEYAYVSNELVPVNKLSLPHKLLVAGLANSELSKQQLEKFHDLLLQVQGDNWKDGGG